MLKCKIFHVAKDLMTICKKYLIIQSTVYQILAGDKNYSGAQL